jgi:L-iditol 2-dehydrogenase
VDEKTLLGSYSASIDIQEEALGIVFEGYGEGYDLTRLVSHRFPLSDAVEAIAIASRPTATSMKIVIEAA